MIKKLLLCTIYLLAGLSSLSCYFDNSYAPTGPITGSGIVLALGNYPDIAVYKVSLSNGNDTTSFYQKAAGDRLYVPLDAGVQWEIVVDGYDNKGMHCATWSGKAVTGDESPQTVDVALVEVQLTIPGSPRGLTAVMDNGQVRLLWQACTRASGYRIYRAEDSLETPQRIDTCLQTVFRDATVENGRTYYYRVSAVNRVGESELSFVASVTVSGETVIGPVAATPSNVNAQATSFSTIDIMWDAVTGADTYRIYRQDSPTGVSSLISSVTGESCTDTSLAASTTYYYCVSAENAAGQSPKSALVSAVTWATIPNVPSGLTVESSSESTVRLSWNDVPDMEYYRVYRSEVSGGPYVAIDSVISASCVADELTSETTFLFTVSACNASGCSDMSSEVSAQTLAPSQQPPAAPEQAVAQTLSSSSIRINWSASSGASLYTVYRGLSADAVDEYLVSLTAISYTDSDLQPTTTYYYAVSASNSSGESSRSVTTSATTGGGIGIPDGLIATAISTSAVELQWQATDGADAYTIQRGVNTTGPFDVFTAIVATSYTDSDVAPASTYYYRVIAMDNGIMSEPSDFISVAIPLDVPATPGNLWSQALSSSEILVGFDEVSGATGYRVYGAQSEWGNYELLGEIGSPSYTHSGLSASTQYFYKVSAYNSGGESAASDPVSAVTQGLTAVHFFCVIDPEKCNNCGNGCIQVCPNGAISVTMYGDRAVKTINKSLCNAEGCQACKTTCESKGYYAISLQQENVLSKVRVLLKR